MKPIISKTLGTFILLLIFVGLLAPTALAQEAVQLSLQPVSDDGEVVVLELVAKNVTNMYGAEFRISYDPALVAVQDAQPDKEGGQIEAGTLLPANQGFVVANAIDEAEGTITFAMTLLNPAPAANGSGPLARLTVKRLQPSATTLNIIHAKLVSADLQTISSQTNNFNLEPVSATDNTALNAPVPDSSGISLPLWLMITAIVILGGLALASLIIFGISKPKQPSTSTLANRPVSPSKGTLSSDSQPGTLPQQSFPSPETPRRSG